MCMRVCSFWFVAEIPFPKLEIFNVLVVPNALRTKPNRSVICLLLSLSDVWGNVSVSDMREFFVYISIVAELFCKNWLGVSEDLHKPGLDSHPDTGCLICSALASPCGCL